MSSSEIFLGVFDWYEAKSVKEKLKKEKIEVELRNNDKTCKTGCKPSVELWGQEKDMEQLVNFFRQEQGKIYDGLNINPEHLSQIYDPAAKEVVCQACGAKFSPELTECPDCGLCYG